MDPPSPPPLSTSAQQPHKDDQYIGEKYRKLKRRYFDLEEVNFYAINLTPADTPQKFKEAQYQSSYPASETQSCVSTGSTSSHSTA